MTIQGIGTKLIITKIDQEQTSAAGILLTNMQDPNPRALIYSMSAEAKEKAPDLNPGDAIVLEWRNTAQVKDQGKDYYVVDISSVYGKVI